MHDTYTPTRADRDANADIDTETPKRRSYREHRYTDTQTNHRYTDNRCIDTQIRNHNRCDPAVHGYTNTPTHRYSDTQIHRYSDTRHTDIAYTKQNTLCIARGEFPNVRLTRVKPAL